MFSTFISFIFLKQIKPTCFIGIICYYKGNNWVNKELEKLGKENFLHTLYDKHLKEEFGPQISPESVITEGGKVN
ncbi:hypothetical protein ACLJKH_003648 [Bacillus cereus]